jgi:hypothetical protein
MTMAEVMLASPRIGPWDLVKLEARIQALAAGVSEESAVEFLPISNGCTC